MGGGHSYFGSYWLIGNIKFFFFPLRTWKVLKKEIRSIGKVEGNKIYRKIKNRFKLNKLILFVYSNSFYLFLFII